MAAVAAARDGARVILIEPTAHLGGIYSSGLAVADSRASETLGGLSLRFFFDVGRYYGSEGPKYSWEPHTAEQIFNSYANSCNIEVHSQASLEAVVVKDTVIQSVTLSDATRIYAAQWIDASYEGDLMAGAGASYTVGRESRAQYGETRAGWGQQYHLSMPALGNDGQLMRGIHPDPGATVGQADSKIMAYSFRTCLTDRTSNAVPLPRPANYNPARYEALARYIGKSNIQALQQIVGLTPTVNNKFCLLHKGVFSTDYPGGGWAYPNASQQDRAAILQDHYDYVAGWLYFVANDPSVPASIRSEMRRFGLPLDEFVGNDHWPWQMYVREGRRMLGQYVFSQGDVLASVSKPDSVAVGNWYVDSHHCDCVAADGKIAFDGGIWQTPSAFFQIPFRALLPKPSEVSNIAVTFCVSASHVGFAAVRVEPLLMSLGEAAGVAAVIAIKTGQHLSEVDYASLRAKLLEHGAVLST